MRNCCPSFSLSQCKYEIERNRETTARITVWRCYGVKRSYTLETSYCGCSEGLYKVNTIFVFRSLLNCASIILFLDFFFFFFSLGISFGHQTTKRNRFDFLHVPVVVGRRNDKKIQVACF